MRKQKLVLILVLFISANVFAQRDWQWQNPLPTGQVLYDCKFTDSLTVFAVGEAGTILKSTNKGNTWTIKNPTYITLTKLFILNNSIIFAAGNSGTVLKTTNAGVSWTNISASSTAYSNSLAAPTVGMDFIDENTGVLVGNRYGQKTTNGGQSWTPMYIAGTFTDVKCLTSTKYLAISKDAGDEFYITYNGGANWYQASFGTPNKGLLNLNFMNNLTGYAAGNQGEVIKTTNGGNTWFDISSSSINWLKMKFFNEQNGVGISDNLIYATTNGGSNWVPYYSLPGPGTLIKYGVDISQNKSGLVVGEQGQIAKSNDCLTWSLSNSSFTTRQFVKSVVLNNGNIIAITSFSDIFKSTDEGVNWSLLSSINIDLRNIQFIDNQTGWITGGTSTGYPQPPRSTGSVYLTTNGGENWSLKLFDSTSIFYHINFLNNLTGYALCKTNMKTTNGGLNWFNANWGWDNFRTICFLNKDSIFGSSWNGNIAQLYFSSNAGANWTTRTPSNFHAEFVDIKFINNKTGYAGYNYGNSIYPNTGILFTTDCGENWDIRQNNTFGNIGSLKIINQTLFAIGQNVTYSIDNGQTWTKENIPTNYSVNYFLTTSNNSKGYLFGPNGMILYSSALNIPIDIKLTNANIPENFALQQNYPNPFNPSTRINYELRNTNYVSLKVFDLLGKEVATLVNEKQNAGSYAVDFNSSEFNLPSGIYFYTLSAGEFKETRKMILIK